MAKKKTSSTKHEKGGTPRALREDVPFTAKLPDGRTLFVLVPAKLCEVDVSGEVVFTPRALEFLDRVQALAMNTPEKPTPGLIRALRTALGLTQAQLGEQVGVTKMTVARWEWGMLSPSPESAKALDKLRRRAARRGVAIAA